MICPECKSHEMIKRGFVNGKQDYQCAYCGKRTIYPLGDNILVIGDTHEPATRKGYLEHCIAMRDKWKCNEVVHIGDVADFHSINYHEHAPDADAIGAELTKVRNKLKGWVEAFPNVKVCLGNHDLLVYRKAKTHGLSREFFKSMNEILQVPETWVFDSEFQIQGIKFFHGTGFSGKYVHANAMMQHRQNCVIGHSHSVAGIEYGASKKDLIWGMSVGCGIDDTQVVFEYGQEYPRKSVIACGIIYQGQPIVEIMKL
jgi:predicted phosphodiesterase